MLTAKKGEQSRKVPSKTDFLMSYAVLSELEVQLLTTSSSGLSTGCQNVPLFRLEKGNGIEPRTAESKPTTAAS